ncbi:MAG TPA: hypothetical protein VNT51_09130 [Miltoncostaeaceae bacterium]|nr:hypothetical protein [Miltoncostaeaceae bacterium]
MRVLTLNAGSSSLRHALFDVDPAGARRLQAGNAEEVGDGHGEAAARLLARLARDGVHPDAVGHRVVHGGPAHAAPARVDDALVAELGDLTRLAPLHMPPALDVLRRARAALGAVPHVACFDTAFHRGMPEIAQRLPLPERLWQRGVRRYGFHGLSYEGVLDRLPEARRGRAVLCHLGNGASMAAVRDGRPVDTTMALTPAGGLMMGTRTGDLDPGVLIHVMRTEGLDADGLERLVTRESGLRGVSGGTSDVRTLLAAAPADPAARRALDLFAHLARRALGAMAASLGGLDVLVFTGGIGAHAAPVRAAVCDGLEHLGVRLDPGRNAGGGPVIGADGWACAVHVVEADEERVIARHAAAHAAP